MAGDASKRVGIGIKGLDELIQGGVPRGSFTVISGGPGTGKSIFGMQYLVNGARNGEKGLFISAEQPENDIIEQAAQFGWDLQKMKGTLDIVAVNTEDLSEINAVNTIRELLDGQQYSRLVIDSLSSFIYSPSTPLRILTGASKGIDPSVMSDVRRANVMLLIDMAKRTGITALGLAQKIEGTAGETSDMVSEFKGDGLINLALTSIGSEENRTIQIKKMRKTKLNSIPYKFEFYENGIEVIQQ